MPTRSYARRALVTVAVFAVFAAGSLGATASRARRSGASTPTDAIGHLALTPDKARAAAGRLEGLIPNSGQIQTTAYTFQTRDTCNQKWTPIQSAPDWFVIGNCEPGTFFHVGQRQDNPDGNSFDGGQIFGDFGGNCGWIQTTRLAQYDNYVPANPCVTGRNPSTNDAAFIFQGGGCTAQDDPAHGNSLADWCIYTSPSGGDGYPVPTVDTYFPGGCPEYANFYPWSSNPYPANYAGMAPYKGTVNIRYLVRFPDSAYGSGYWFMADDHSKGSGQGNWMFIPVSCFQ